MKHSQPSDVLSYALPAATKRMHVSLAILANVILLVDSFLAGILLFTLLPVSVAIVALPLNAAIFIIWRARFRMTSYLAAVHGITLLLSIVFIVLIATLGREYFKWIFDWA